METIETIIEDIIATEGGYVNHPQDKGGVTNMGITKETLRRWRKAPTTDDDVRSLEKKEAEQIYLKRYYLKPRINKLPKKIQPFVMDDAVLSGANSAIRSLQRYLRVLPDGIIGPKTIAAAKHESPTALLIGLTKRRVERLCRIVQRDPDQNIFLVGWMRRTLRFL
jgi:lysozyme family protein